MKQLNALLFLALLPAGLCAQTISTTGSSTFDPNVLNITLGQTVTFNIIGTHTATEVSQATWNANGTTSNGGFNFNTGTHTFTPSVAGTYYYVCIFHVGSMGMKGQIIVSPSTGVSEQTTEGPMRVFPNPADNELQVVAPGSAGTLSVTLVDSRGRTALETRTHDGARLDVSGLPNGRYVVVLRDAAGEVVHQERVNIVR